MLTVSELGLPGLRLLEIAPIRDERGFFARVYDRALFAEHGMEAEFPQWSVSFNAHRGTLRGLHWQAEPYPEIKLVRCTRGAIFDVAVDVSDMSPTRGRWAGVELSADNHRTLYIPPGFAHGFQTLTDDAEVLYHISTPYRADLARGLKWDDPVVGVAWPEAAHRIISDRDQALPFLDGA